MVSLLICFYFGFYRDEEDTVDRHGHITSLASPLHLSSATTSDKPAPHSLKMEEEEDDFYGGGGGGQLDQPIVKSEEADHKDEKMNMSDNEDDDDSDDVREQRNGRSRYGIC